MAIPPSTTGPLRARSRRRPAVLVALAIGAAVALAPAGQQLVEDDGTPYGWDLGANQANVVDGKVTYFLDPQGTNDAITGPKNDLDALRDGIAAWEVESTGIRFQEDASRSATGRNANDRVNYVGWTNGQLGPLTFAATFPTRTSGRFTDTDVLFNDNNFSWNTRTPGVSGETDIESLMAHEWGHALGADHIPLRTSTMYFATEQGAISFRALADDDEALVGRIYPNDTFRDERGSITGRVTRTGASDHRGIHVVAVSLSTGEPAGSTLTLPDGTYELPGLRKGAYRLIAAPTLPLDPQMNEFWHSANTKFLPALLRTASANPSPIQPIPVNPGETSANADFIVSSSTRPFEPDDLPAQATSLQVGDGVCARLESSGDEDHYAFDGVADQVVSVSVHAWSIGSEADPAVEIRRDTGAIVVPEVDDERPPSIFRNRIEGVDLDVRLTAVRLPVTGRYVIRVRNVSTRDSSDGFYVLTVTGASDAPSGVLTRTEAQPPRIDADGFAQSVITVEPVQESGELVGAGATVQLSNDGDGDVTGVVDVGDGTYMATVTAPRVPGDDLFDLRVTSSAGTVDVPDALRLVYLGPADGERSDLSVSPRRIDADGSATSTARLLPRDARGEALGAGRTVSFTTASTGSPQVGAVTDTGDGVYSAEVQSNAAVGSLQLRATVDGVLLPDPVEVAFGFPLQPVLEQSLLDSAAHASTAGVSKKVLKKLAGAQKQAERALIDVEAGAGTREEKQALARTYKAQKKFAGARKKAKGALPDLGTEGELARAVRDAAVDAVARALPNVVKTSDQKKVDAANKKLADGQAAFDAGDVGRAGELWLRAFKKVFRLARNP